MLVYCATCLYLSAKVGDMDRVGGPGSFPACAGNIPLRDSASLSPASPVRLVRVPLPSLFGCQGNRLDGWSGVYVPSKRGVKERSAGAMVSLLPFVA